MLRCPGACGKRLPWQPQERLFKAFLACFEDSMPDCIFCKIIRGEIPCAKLFENEDVIAFLDIAPARPGHTLILPKLHAATLFDLPPELGTAVVAAIQKVGTAVMEATGATGLNVFQNNFPAAGQAVPHLHWHLIPRHEDDGLQLWEQGSYADASAMNAMAEGIKSALR